VKKKGLINKIVSFMALLCGIIALSYPHISQYLSEKNSTRATDEYAQKMQLLTEEKQEAMWKEAEEYNENLTGSPVHDPFVPGSGIVMPDNYYKVLNVGGTMAAIEIPKINVKLPIYHGTNESVLNKAVGHMEGSALPIGGKGRHSVITGHTGLAHAKIFTDLTELAERDHFYVKVLGETLAYEIDQIAIIEPDQTEYLKVVEGEDYVTLLTCTPYGVNSHRLLVRGKRTPYDPSKKESPNRGVTNEQQLLLRVAIVTAGGVVGIIIIVEELKRLKKKL
jgi:sortase A